MDGLIIVGGDGRAVLASRFASSSSSNTLARAQYARIHLDRWHEDVLTAQHVSEQQRAAQPRPAGAPESIVPASAVFAAAFPSKPLKNPSLQSTDPLGRPSTEGDTSDTLISLRPPSAQRAPSTLIQNNTQLPASDVRLSPAHGTADLPPLLWVEGVPPLAASLGKGRPEEEDSGSSDSDSEPQSAPEESRVQHLLPKGLSGDWSGKNPHVSAPDAPSATPAPPSRDLELPLAPGTVLFHKSHNDLHFLLPVSSATTPVLMPPTFLDFFVRLLSDYVGGAQYLTTDGVRENFDLIYALMEEVLDDGGAWPILTQNWLLEKIVPPETGWAGLAERWADKVSATISASSSAATDAAQIRAALASGGAPWRPPLVKHPREDILFDMIERVEGTFSRRGHLVRATSGVRVDATSRLSESPQVSLALVPKSGLTQPSFHPCVRIRPWHKEGILDFVPPDGRFTLAHFSCPTPPLAEVEAAIPFKLECMMRVSAEEERKVDFRLDLDAAPASGKAGYGRLSPSQTVSQLVLSFQVPEDATDMDCSLFAFASATASTSSGGEKRAPDEAGVWLYDPRLRVLRWALGTIRPGRNVRMRGSFRTRDPSPVVASTVGVQFTLVEGGHQATPSAGRTRLTGTHATRITVSSSGTAPDSSGMEGFGSSSKSQNKQALRGGAGARSKVFKGVRGVLMADLEYRWA